MKNVLIMEDSMSLAFDWRDIFELNDVKVTLCTDADDTIVQLYNNKFDLLVVDMFIDGGKGGLHVMAEMRKMRENAPPVIAVTGAKIPMTSDKNTNLFLQQAKTLGASDTLEKPFRARELLAAAQKLWN